MLINSSERQNETNERLKNYLHFVKIVENTPQSINRSHMWIRGFHGAIGLCGEANEVLQIFKKDLFGKNKPISRPDIVNELGDCLWYLTLLCDAFNVTLKELIDYNTTKLAARYAEKMQNEDDRGEYIALREGRKIAEKEAGREEANQTLSSGPSEEEMKVAYGAEYEAYRNTLVSDAAEAVEVHGDDALEQAAARVPNETFTLAGRRQLFLDTFSTYLPSEEQEKFRQMLEDL